MSNLLEYSRSKACDRFWRHSYRVEKRKAELMGLLMLLLALLAAPRLTTWVADLVTAALAIGAAFVLCLRHARHGAALLDRAAAPPRLEGKLWYRNRKEQRLLERATRDVLSTAEFMTQYPFASARGKSLADGLRRRLRD